MEYFTPGLLPAKNPQGAAPNFLECDVSMTEYGGFTKLGDPNMDPPNSRIPLKKGKDPNKVPPNFGNPDTRG